MQLTKILKGKPQHKDQYYEASELNVDKTFQTQKSSGSSRAQ